MKKLFDEFNFEYKYIHKTFETFVEIQDFILDRHVLTWVYSEATWLSNFVAKFENIRILIWWKVKKKHYKIRKKVKEMRFKYRQKHFLCKLIYNYFFNYKNKIYVQLVKLVIGQCLMIYSV